MNDMGRADELRGKGVAIGMEPVETPDCWRRWFEAAAEADLRDAG